MRSITRLSILLFLPALLGSSCRKSDFVVEHVETVTDLGGGTGTVTWNKETEYLLSGFVFVNDGQTLTIEAGTVIRAITGQADLASALIVARGGRIVAEGNISEPIVFTVEGDDLEGSVPMETRGLWGGVIILGHAPINTESGEAMIEGIPISEPRGIYGGSNEQDNSGILRYVSIRHGGTNIGEDNEINGLTLGGVGNGTVIDHVEVISNADDGVEIFGGSVNCTNLAVAFCGDDGFDLDQGYHGKGQFWLCINSTDSDKCMEVTGGDRPVENLPGNFPMIYNVTLIGDPDNLSHHVIHFQEYGGGILRNSILLHPGAGVALLYSGKPGDSYSLFETGKLAVENTVFYPGSDPVPRFYTYSELGEDLTLRNGIMADSLTAWETDYDNPGLQAAENGCMLLPSSTVFDHLAPYIDPWFEQVTYKGAFGSNNWITGWTLIYESSCTTTH
jgi:hypothetical protein